MEDALRKFSPESRALLISHETILRGLPVAFRPLILRQLRAWESLFPPEQESLTRILHALARTTDSDHQTLFRALSALDVPDTSDLDPLFDEEKTLDRCLRHFKKEGTYQTWRLAVDEAFQRLTAQAPSDDGRAPKLVFVMLGEGTAPGDTLEDPDRRFLSYFWHYLEPLGTLFTSVTMEAAAAPLVSLFRSTLNRPQIKVWAIETGSALAATADAAQGAIWFSFEHLRPVLDRVTRKLADTMMAGVSGPEALYAKISDFKMEELGLPRYDDPRIRKFVEQIILQGSGALVINNTFAEWTALQALRRVEPDLLMVRFGRRRRFVPLRQLDPFQAPLPESGDLPAEDPGESLQDADVLAYYIWLETRKHVRYRDRTHFLIYLEGTKAALLIGPGVKSGIRITDPVRLEDIASTLAGLMGVVPGRYRGKVLKQILTTSS
jgi:hypothetical protein